MKIWQILLVSAAAGVTLPAVAQMVEGPATRAEVEASVRDRLGRFDADKDGVVTRDEMMSFAKARAESRADDQFAAMDTDKNGSISRAEFDAWRASRADRQIVRVERFGGPDGMMPPPPPPGPDGVAPPAPPPPPAMDGKGIVIADAVKRALERFDAADTNKDGRLTPEERKAAREAWRVKVS